MLRFLRTETGSALLLIAGALAALVWANVGPGSYDTVWATRASVRIGSASVDLDLRSWVNSGLMTLFFFVVGLEARREFDLGELRDRKRVALPVMAGAAGICVPVLIYLAFAVGHGTAAGWGAAMSTDTAVALGVLALFGRRLPTALRAFLLTVSVVDDVVALLVIALAYSGSIALPALLTAVGITALVLALHTVGTRRGTVYALLGLPLWVAVLKSGIDPIVTGLLLGLLTYASPASRSELERASSLYRRFREQPTPELARSARRGLAAAISPNDRLQGQFHPWTSYAIVPLFALANAGIRIDAHTIRQAVGSPLTLGILCAYVLGKPIGITGAAWITTRASRGTLRPPIGWGSVLVGGSISGVAFTVSLLIANLAFHGEQLAQAKLAILASVPCSFALAWIITRIIGLLPRRRRARVLLGTGHGIIDLTPPVDPGRDHIRGPHDASVTVVEYGDLECPYCGMAEPVVRELLASAGDVRYVWRHLPLTDVHPHAQMAAEAAEAAAAQGAFWRMHDLMLVHQDALRGNDLLRYAEQLGLDTDRFQHDLRTHANDGRVAEDVDSADLSGVAGTPTFFINGRRHEGAYDISALTDAVRVARARTTVTR